MARKNVNSRNFAVGNLSSSVTLLTLDDNTVKEGDLGESTLSGYRVISIDGTWSIHDLTPGEGPIDFGVAHSDYSVAEILQALSSNAGWAPTDLIEMEQSRRLVRLIGTFSGQDANETFNDGKPKRTKLRWPFRANQNMVMFAVNRSGAALTTGAVLEVAGKAYLRHNG